MDASLNCPNGCGEMKPETFRTATTIHGIQITLDAQGYKCPECGLEAATQEQAGTMQTAMMAGIRANDYKRRCLVTGNLCGTDTRPVGQPCPCTHCRQILDPGKDYPASPEERRQYRTEQQLNAHTIKNGLSQQTVDAIHHP